MPTIHIFRASQATIDYKNSIALLNYDDAVILLDDAVYLINRPIINELIQTVSLNNIYVLEQHALARGIKPNQGITPINLASFPTLMLSFTQSITWQ